MLVFLLILILVIAGGVWLNWKTIVDQLGSLLGMDLGSENDEMMSMPIAVHWSRKNVQIVYLYLAGWMIRKSSSDPKAKIQFIQQYFMREFGEFHAENQAELLNAIKHNTNIRSVSNWIRHHLKDGAERIRIVDFLFEIARIDGKIIDRQFVAIVRLAELIGVRAVYLDKKMKEFAEQHFRSYKNQTGFFESPSVRAKHLLVLQLPENFTEEQLRRSYRKLAKKYHPDTQIHHSEEEKKLAHTKFLEVQEAYDYFISLN